MPHSSTGRTAITALSVALAPVAGFVLSALFSFYGEISHFAEFAINTALAVLVEVWILLGVITYYLTNKQMIVPFKNPDLGIHVLKIGNSLAHLPDQFGRKHKLVSDVLRGAVEVELERIAAIDQPGRARFSSEGLDSFYESILQSLNEDHEICATCFTDMDHFWFLKNVGDVYLDLNIRLLQERAVSMRRLFGAANPDIHSEPKKRELIRLLMAGGSCACKVIPEHETSQYSLEEKDMFLILDRRSDAPLLGLRWALSASGEVDFIDVVYDEADLKLMYTRFCDMWSIPSARPVTPQQAGRIDAPLTTQYTRDAWALYSRTDIPTNRLDYLAIDPADPPSPDEVAKYWTNLAGTFVRPAPDGLDFLRQRLQTLKINHPHPRIAMLGCTPETRVAVAEVFADDADVTLFDLNPTMRDAMDIVAGQISPQHDKIIRSHRLSQIDWLLLDRVDQAFDIVIGVDVANMVLHDELPQFLDVLAAILNANGSLLFQVVVEPLGAYRELIDQLPEDLWAAYGDLSEQSSIDPGEMFSRLCFRQLDARSKICSAGEVVQDLEPIEGALDRFGFQTRGLSARYRFCNSTLSLYSENEYRSRFQAHGFDVEAMHGDSNAGELNYTRLFRWYALTKRQST